MKGVNLILLLFFIIAASRVCLGQLYCEVLVNAHSSAFTIDCDTREEKSPIEHCFLSNTKKEAVRYYYYPEGEVRIIVIPLIFTYMLHPMFQVKFGEADSSKNLLDRLSQRPSSRSGHLRGLPFYTIKRNNFSCTFNLKRFTVKGTILYSISHRYHNYQSFI